MKKTENRGGKRPGSGRKAGVERLQIGVRLPREMVEFLKSDSDQTATQMIETAVREHYKISLKSE